MHVRLAAIAALAWASTAAWADDKITLKVADTLPVTHYMSTEGAKFFMSRATELTGGRLAFEYYPSEQLGKARDLLRLTQTGVADIAYIAPSYASEKLPLSGVAELPGLYHTACEGTHGLYKLAQGGILAEREFKPLGLVVLMAWNLGPYQIESRLPKLQSLADFKGLKIRAAGGSWDLVVRALGASPVNIPAPEIREAMERGTVDASVGPAISLKPYDMISVSKSMTRGAAFGSFSSTFTMNLRKFRGLPPDVQAALVQSGHEATEHLCAYVDTNEQKAADEAASEGVAMWRLTPADSEAADKLLAPVVGEWVQGLDARHLPADQVLADFRAAAH